MGGVRVDRYVLVNSVQMQKLAALCPDGVYLTVQDAIRDYGIEADIRISRRTSRIMRNIPI